MASSITAKEPRPSAIPRNLAPDALMQMIGSDAGYDPMPVTHHEFAMRNPELIDRAVVEFMSLVYSTTIRNGHRAPVMVDGAGKLYTIEQVAQNRGWSLDWAQRAFNKAVTCGFVRPGTGKKGDFPPHAICLVGTVKPEIQKDIPPVGNQEDAECTLRKLRRSMSEKEVAQWERMDAETKARFAEEEFAACEEDDRIEADAIWLARQMRRQRKNTRFARYGLVPDAPAAKRRKQEPVVQLSLIEPAGDGDRSVHSAADDGANTPPNRSVQSDASLFTLPEVFYPEEEPAASSKDVPVVRPKKPNADDAVADFYRKLTGRKWTAADASLLQSLEGVSAVKVKIGIARSVFLAKAPINSFRYCVGAIDQVVEDTAKKPIEDESVYLNHIVARIMQKNGRNGRGASA